MMKDLYGQNFSRLELVSADLLDADSIFQATKGVDWALHVAHPVGLKGKDSIYVKPALVGTKALLDGCKAHNVKRVIITGSTGIIVDEKNLKESYTEDDHYRIVKKSAGYYKSKVL